MRGEKNGKCKWKRNNKWARHNKQPGGKTTWRIKLKETYL